MFLIRGVLRSVGASPKRYYFTIPAENARFGPLVKGQFYRFFILPADYIEAMGDPMDHMYAFFTKQAYIHENYARIYVPTKLVKQKVLVYEFQYTIAAAPPYGKWPTFAPKRIYRPRAGPDQDAIPPKARRKRSKKKLSPWYEFPAKKYPK
jgi:hypothetical protein